jgi:hypothetical protein
MLGRHRAGRNVPNLDIFYQANRGFAFGTRQTTRAARLLGWRIILEMPQTRLTPTLITPNALIWVLMGPDRGFAVESRERFPLGQSAPGLSDFTCTTAPIVLSEFSKSEVTGELFE